MQNGMANGFEFFEGSATEGTLSPRVTIRKGGQLVLTKAAVNLIGGGASHVQIGFKPEDCRRPQMLRKVATFLADQDVVIAACAASDGTGAHTHEEEPREVHVQDPPWPVASSPQTPCPRSATSVFDGGPG